jgi:hypothetical protein
LPLYCQADSTQGDWVHANNATNAFYNDATPEQQKKYEAMLRPHALATKHTPTTGAAHLKIPSTYLVCELDNAMPMQAQEGMVKGAQDGGAVDFKSEKIHSGHSPFMTKPQETAEYLLRAAAS